MLNLFFHTLIKQRPKLNTETGSPASPTIIVEKLTVKLDAQQLIAILNES
jgi:hypothetical protein